MSSVVTLCLLLIFSRATPTAAMTCAILFVFSWFAVVIALAA
jgi:ABC-type molybdate transport system permease subunit